MVPWTWNRRGVICQERDVNRMKGILERRVRNGVDSGVRVSVLMR